ncbi:MAG: hypothetical protein GY799_08265, partial [Desulfobulbaceae bacterium]|nr:hypothetical protein [Desulfobulbaceae bacterium]
MRFKDLSIGTKMNGMAAVLLFLLILVGWQGVRGLVVESTEAEKMGHLMEIDAALLQREIDHLEWAAGVNSFLMDQSKTNLEIETNENKCALGRWLGDHASMADVEKNVPEMKAMLDAMKGDHTRLHRSASEMQKVLSGHNGDRVGAAAALAGIYQESSIPALAAVRGALHEMSQ